MASDLKVVTISFTNRCNLSCVHCGYDFHNKNKFDELSSSFFLNILTEALGIGARIVNITGGEIFCREDIWELIEGAVELGYYVCIESNGTLLTSDHFNRLKTLGENIRLAISMDGFSEEVHDAIRGQGSFVKTMEAINNLSKYQIPARVNTVLHEVNLPQISAMAKFFVDELGLGFRLIPFILEYGQGVYACKSSGVKYEDLEILLNNFFFDFLRERQSKKLLSIELRTALVPVDIENHYICSWGKSLIGIGPSGVASLCHVSNDNPQFIFGDLKEESLLNIWENNENLIRFRDFNVDLLRGVCGNCLAREVCRGGCRLHAISKYNNFYAPEPQCQTVYNLGKFPEYALENPMNINFY